MPGMQWKSFKLKLVCKDYSASLEDFDCFYVKHVVLFSQTRALIIAILTDTTKLKTTFHTVIIKRGFLIFFTKMLGRLQSKKGSHD